MAYNTPRTGGLLLVCDEAPTRRLLQRKMQIYRRVRAVGTREAGSLDARRSARAFTAIVIDAGSRLDGISALVGTLRERDPRVPIVLLHRERLGAASKRRLAEQAVLPLVFSEATWPDLKAQLRHAVILERARGNRFVAEAVEALANEADLTIKQAELVAMAADVLPRKEMAKQLGVSPSTLVNRIYALVERLGLRSFEVLGKTILKSALDRAAAEAMVKAALVASRKRPAERARTPGASTSLRA